MGILVSILAYGVLLLPALFIMGVCYEVLLKLPFSARARRRGFVVIACVLCTPAGITYLVTGGIVPNALLLAAILFWHRELALDYLLLFWIWIPGVAVTALIAARAPERWFIAREAANATG